MSRVSKLSLFKKDKNNNLNMEQCKVFIKDYKKYKKGKAVDVVNPKTNKKLTDDDRLEYIYNICSEKHSTVAQDSSSSSDTNTLTFNSYKDVEDLIYIVTNNADSNKEFINRIFTHPISYNVGLDKLREYINKNGDNEFVIAYHNILKEINELFRELRRLHMRNTSQRPSSNWDEIYVYDPLKISDAHNIKDTLNKTTEELEYLWVRVGTNGDPLSKRLYNKSSIELTRIILYSENNTNKEDIKKHLEDNKYRYYALQFMLVCLRDFGTRSDMDAENIDIYIRLVDKLLAKDIIYKYPDASVSISKSLSWENTPRSSSSNHSHFQSRANISKHKKTKLELLNGIMNNDGYNNEINDFDVFAGDPWEEMPLNKLKHVIKITYLENNKMYANAFYARTLYQGWRLSVKENKPFLNPFNRKPFSVDDEEEIINAMINSYPDIKKPKIGSGRADISCKIINDSDLNMINIVLSYIVKTPNNNKTSLVSLIRINIPISFEEMYEVPDEYIHNILIENIKNLARDNKIFGKTIPFKIKPIFQLYNNNTLTYDEYVDFFKKVRLLL